MAPSVTARSRAAPPPPTGEDSALYVGGVVHHRVHGIQHTLRYRLYMLLLDIDTAEARIRPLRWLTHGRFGLMSWRARDHGDRSGTPLREQVETHLSAAGIDIAGGPVRLLCMPRILGYGFNPLAVYFCHRPDGTLAALLYEVTNTFHERHSYLVAVPSPPPPGEGAFRTPIRQTTEKTFFVSPFMDMDLTYDFTVHAPDQAVSVVVAVRRGDTPILTASFAGARRPLNDRELLRAWLSHPLLTWKVMWGIHWEALRGMLKGAKYRNRDKPPAHPVTLGAPRQI
ncbi:MAG: DUF1365 domain-containing protein [Brevundimonas sp.]|uniref:DUF1365 domain-containing protein n=1 Tax=Brevundimonas sp. TaxID=1871086 RepID=UPI002733C731|nr:DUF1365 domain-containing protein [Brevundimonas sp.]MDP3404275.1 DUF1365 domain-containing protein [Brevundimonas sp.]